MEREKKATQLLLFEHRAAAFKKCVHCYRRVLTPVASSVRSVALPKCLRRALGFYRGLYIIRAIVVMDLFQATYVRFFSSTYPDAMHSMTFFLCRWSPNFFVQLFFLLQMRNIWRNWNNNKNHRFLCPTSIKQRLELPLCNGNLARRSLPPTHIDGMDSVLSA